MRSTLPPRTPTTLRAFWLVMSSLCGAGVAIAASLTRRDPRLLIVGIPTAVSVAIPGIKNPQLVDPPYRAWNKLGRMVNHRARAWVTMLGFAAMVTTRHTGHRPVVARRSTGTSGWLPKRSQRTTTYKYQDDRAHHHHAEDALARFATDPGHVWIGSMRPIIRLLGAMETDRGDDAEPPSDVYTLY